MTMARRTAACPLTFSLLGRMSLEHPTDTDVQIAVAAFEVRVRAARAQQLIEQAERLLTDADRLLAEACQRVAAIASDRQPSH
jgi:hypothetical protein